MAMCQAFGCSNRISKCKNLGFFTIPDPLKEPERCRVWLQKIGTDKFDFRKYKYSKNRVVCEEHFTPDCIENAMSTRLGFSGRKRLKPGSIPTIFSFKKTLSQRQSSVKRSEASYRRQVVSALLQESMPGTSTSSLPEPVEYFLEDDSLALNIGEVVNLETAQPESPTKVIKSPKKESKRTKHVGTSRQRIVQQVKSPKKIKAALAPTGIACQTDGPDVTDFTQQFPEPEYEVKKASEYLDHVYHVTTTTHVSSKAPEPVVNIEEHDDEGDGNSSSNSMEFSSSSDNYNSEDTTWQPSSSTTSDEESPATLEQKYLYQSKFIVFIHNLELLFYSIKCTKCNLKTSEVEDFVSGSLVMAKLYCPNGHLILDWKSQPVIGKTGVGNLLIASAILFSGNTFSRIKQFAEFVGLNFIGRSTFYSIQSKYLNPVVNRQYYLQQDALMSSLVSGKVALSGDGRCDSPGYSAKYCTYSMMDMNTDKIVSSNVVQVSETTSSVAMEKVGFQRCMQELDNKSINVDLIATDRHVGIRSAMKKDFSTIDHQFDVWHLAKSVKKKLIAKCRSRDCANLLPWLHAISNHLWWSAQNCGGDADLLVEMWTSLTYHITNVHEWVVGENFRRCAHPPLSEEGQSKDWLEKESPAHNALIEILFNKYLLRDVRLLNKACHTGQLEVFHGALLKYCPKRLHFDMQQMWCRTQLAIIDHNSNTGRKHSVVKVASHHSADKGHKRYRLSYTKATKKWTVKPIYEPKMYGFAFELMESVLSVKLGNIEVDEVQLRPLPRNIAPTEAPNKEEAVQMYRSRFSKKKTD